MYMEFSVRNIGAELGRHKQSRLRADRAAACLSLPSSADVLYPQAPQHTYVRGNHCTIDIRKLEQTPYEAVAVVAARKVVMADNKDIAGTVDSQRP